MAQKLRTTTLPRRAGEARLLAVKVSREIFGRAAAQAGFALAIVGTREKEEQAGDEGQDQARIQFAFQSGIPSDL